ncbi:MAG: cardiolipin synthase [Desulfobacterales bacterium]|nr:cardiolipin synthase [Desulfobacterales bacterium]
MPDIRIAIDVWVLIVPLLLHAIGLLYVVDIIMNGRTSQGTIAWAMALLLFPYLAVPLYMVFGGRKLREYAVARQAGDRAINHLGRELEAGEELQELAGELRDPQIDALCNIARLPVSGWNQCSLLINGEATFNSILDGIRRAEKYVLIQFFIIKDDTIGRQLRDLCVAKVRAGIPVYFLYDKIGCGRLPRTYLDPMRAAGVNIVVFRVGRGLINRFRVNFRNHRKIVVIDGHTAWVGGHNVGDEYLGKGKQFGHWRDTHVIMQGPVALAVQLSFCEDWYWATETLPKVFWKTPPKKGTEAVLCMPTGPSDMFETGALWVVHAINMAWERCWIFSPYFVPDSSVINALQLAALRGVDVRIVIPANPDKQVVWWAAHSYFKTMGEVGVSILKYRKGFMHQKVVLIDDRLATIGTANLDNRSLRINFEITMMFTEREFIQKVAAMCEVDFAACIPLTPAEVKTWSLPFRLATRAARLLSPIL